MAGADGPDVPEGSWQQPITIEDDIDLPQSDIGTEVRNIVNRVHDCGGRLVKAEEDEENQSEDPWADEEAIYDKINEEIEAINLTEDPEPEREKVSIVSGRCEHWKKGIRNPCVCGTHQDASGASTSDVDFKKFQFVELKEPIVVSRYLADFLEVWQIWSPKAKGNAFVRGLPYARTRNLDGRIDARKNEVCALLEIDTNDDRTGSSSPDTRREQALVEVPLENIKAVRILHKTNKPFPECRFDPIRYPSKEDRETKAPLTCRWEMIRTYPDARYRHRLRPVDGEELRHYNEDDVTKERHRASDAERLTTWRRGHEKVPGGSYIPNSVRETKAEPVSEVQTETYTTKVVCGQKFSVVDIFSGAGGFSKGAEMAGFKVVTACDHWSRCCETYRENFPDTDLHEKSVYDFIQASNTDLTVDRQPADLVHLSPPCQFYSPAHTCPGKNDDANIATLFACEYILLIFRPRFFTVEQTFGLSQDRHSSYFNAFIQGFTRHGYSVKWKVVHLVQFGLPQTRKRLVVMGAAPGETLPSWPEPTHSKEPTGGQKPFTSAVRACRGLVEGENLHDVEGARAVDRAPWDGDKPLERTITTSGGQCYHWSGQRELTLAEFAALQGFPPDFRFRSKCVKKQIGNAFPPVVVKAFMKHIRRHMERVDGIKFMPEQGLLIELDDDDDDDDDEDDDDQKPDIMLKRDDDETNHLDAMDWVDEKEATVVATYESQSMSPPQPHAPAEGKAEDKGGDDAEDDDLYAALGYRTRPSWAGRKRSSIPVRAAKPPSTDGGRRKSRTDSAAFVRPSSLAGSSRDLPIVIEDDNSPAEHNAAVGREYNGMDEDAAPQAALRASVQGAGARPERRGMADGSVDHKRKEFAWAVRRGGFDDGHGCAAYRGADFRASAIWAHDSLRERGSIWPSPARSEEGPEEGQEQGDHPKGKGKEGKRRFTAYADGESPLGSEGGAKRPRGDK